MKFLIFLWPLFLSWSAAADWEANFVATSTKKEFTRTTGKFYAKGGLFRADVTEPLALSLYLNSSSTKAEAALTSFRMRLTTDLQRFSGQIPACLSRTFLDCVSRFSLKKVREEKCGDGTSTQVCEIYIGKGKFKDFRKIEIWHWKGEAEPVFAKNIITKKDGSEIQIEFSGISRKSREPSFFKIPSGYINAGSLDRFLNDFKGQSE